MLTRDGDRVGLRALSGVLFSKAFGLFGGLSSRRVSWQGSRSPL